MKLSEYICLLNLSHDVPIVTYGQNQKSFYFIMRGNLNVFIPTKRANAAVPFEKIDVLGMGEGFGDIAILTGRTK